MSIEAVWTLVVVGGMTVLLARERLGAELVLFLALCCLVVTGVVDSATALKGFGNTAVATIAVLFVVAAAVRETGALRKVLGVLLGPASTVRGAMVRVMLPTAVMSAFVNNTPIIALLIPAIRDYSRRVKTTPSKLLIPLAYAAMLGGTCTLIGTSANLVVSGQLQAAGLEPLGMFELSYVGLPTAIIGLLYMTVLGPRLLPERDDAATSLEAEAPEYLSWVRVADGSPLVGLSIDAAGLRGLPGLFVVEMRRRDGSVRAPVAPEDMLMAGDTIVLTGPGSAVRDLHSFPGLVPTDGVDLVGGDDRNLVEVVISRRSPLVGQTVRDSGFRRRYGAAILGIQHAGEAIETKIGDHVFQQGDTLMLTARAGFAQAWSQSQAFNLVTEVPDSQAPRYHRATHALVIIGLLVVVPSVTGLPMLPAAMAALLALVATGCISTQGVRAAVNFPILILIGSAFGIAEALGSSGAADAIASLVISGTASIGPLALLAAVYALTVAFVYFVGNAAGAAIMFPVALTTAAAAGLEPRPFAIATAMAASAAFATPIGYQNLLVYGPGGYRYTDFLKVGLPLNAVCMAIVLVIVPLVWPLVALG